MSLTDDHVVVEESSAAEPVLTRARPLLRSLVDAHVVVVVAEPSGQSQIREGDVALGVERVIRGAPREGVRFLRLPLDGAEVLLHSDARRVPQVGQVPRLPVHLTNRYMTRDT